MKDVKEQEKARKHDTPKEHINFPTTDPKEMEIYELPEEEFKIIVLRKLSKLQENTDKKLNKVKKIIHE